MIEFPATSGVAPVPAEPGAYGITPPGYRLPPGTRVGRVRLQVADLARSLAFYERVLGFRTLERSPVRAALGAAEDSAPLIALEERPGAGPAPRRGHLGLYHFAILLPDPGALGRLVEHLGRIGAHIGSADHLVSQALYLHDPDGLGIEVYTDRPRAAWQRRGRELLMDSLPLDLERLVLGAGGQLWTGMPGGTMIGHVHLHVGDLDAAAEFYHAALGLDVAVWSYPGALFLSAGGYHHHVGVNTWAGPGAVPPRADDARLLEWELVLPEPADIAAAARSLDLGGYQAREDESGIVSADPWGNRVRLLAAS